MEFSSLSPPIKSYTQIHAMADGMLVDITKQPPKQGAGCDDQNCLG